MKKLFYFNHASHLNIFYNKLKGNVFGRFFSQKCFRLLLEQESITNVSLRIISSLETSRNCPWQSYFLIKTQEYFQQPKFLVNSITIPCFHEGFSKQLDQKLRKFSRKTYVGEFRFDKFVRPQSTAHRIRNSTTDTVLEVLRKEGVF